MIQNGGVTSQVIPVVCESVQQVVGLEGGWETEDFDDVTKLLRIDVDVHVSKVVVVSVLDGNGRALFQVRLNLTGQMRWKSFILRRNPSGKMTTTVNLPPGLNLTLPCPHHGPKSCEPRTTEAIPRLRDQPHLLQRLDCLPGAPLHRRHLPAPPWAATRSFLQFRARTICRCGRLLLGWLKSCPRRAVVSSVKTVSLAPLVAWRGACPAFWALGDVLGWMFSVLQASLPRVSRLYSL